jgi:hypothetical protein
MGGRMFGNDQSSQIDLLTEETFHAVSRFIDRIFSFGIITIDRNFSIR